MAPSFVLTAKGRSHAGDAELLVSRKVVRTADLPTAVLFKHPLPANRIFELIRLKPHFSELTSLSQARCVTEVFLHMVYVGSGTASRHTLLPQVWLDTQGRGMCSAVSRLLGGNAVFTSRRSVRVQWMTSSNVLLVTTG